MRIWLIGLWLMGIPMARNILRAWGDLSIWCRTRERADEVISLGAKFRNNKKELAETVDILITMVTAGDDVDDILFGDGGCIEWLRAWSIVIDMSTIWVEWAERIGAKLSEKWIHFIDAPVTGSTPKAITGELTIFIWGDREIFEKIRPILAMMGTNLQYMWLTGSGQAMKLVNNALVAYSMIWLSEVMKLGGAMWLEHQKLADVIKTLPVSSPYTTMKVDNFVRDEYPMMFSLANMAKDITLAHGEMEKYGLTLDMLTVAHEQYKRWVKDGIGWLDVSAIGKIS
jgi:3-hydroxyisobutyrate dehydrogenase